MYLYSLHGWEDNMVLQHDKKYTEEEFSKICKDIRLKDKHCLTSDMLMYLIKDYGFQTAKYTAGFFVDGD